MTKRGEKRKVSLAEGEIEQKANEWASLKKEAGRPDPLTGCRLLNGRRVSELHDFQKGGRRAGQWNLSTPW